MLAESENIGSGRKKNKYVDEEEEERIEELRKQECNTIFMNLIEKIQNLNPDITIDSPFQES